MPVALALSPHLDDAVFSCGGVLFRLAERGWRVVICTAFTASVPDPQGFALACQLDKGIGPEVDYMALRRAEDRAATEALGLAPPIWLPFAEAPHRFYDSADALFGEARPDDDADRRIAPALAAIADDVAPDLLLAPQAVGSHVDHVQLVHAVLAAFSGRPVLWWRDFPYAIRDCAPEPFLRLMAGMPEHETALTPREREAKRQACFAYQSQLGFQFGGAAGVECFLEAGGAQERFRVQGEPDIDALAGGFAEALP